MLLADSGRRRSHIVSEGPSEIRRGLTLERKQPIEVCGRALSSTARELRGLPALNRTWNDDGTHQRLLLSGVHQRV